MAAVLYELLPHPSLQTVPVDVGDDKLAPVPELLHLALGVHECLRPGKPGQRAVEVGKVCREVTDGFAVQRKSDSIVCLMRMKADKLYARRKVCAGLFPVIVSDDSGPHIAFRIQKCLEHIPNGTYTRLNYRGFPVHIPRREYVIQRYSRRMSNLVPEPRVDKNGHLVVRHVRPDNGNPPQPSAVPAPVLPQGITERRIIKTQFVDFRANSEVYEDMDCSFDWDELESKVDNLSDLDVSRFGLYLNHTEEESAAFLLALDGNLNALSDMTLIYDAYRHAGISSDPDEFEDLGLDPHDIYFNVLSDHLSMKEYMRSQGTDYVKLDLLTKDERERAMKWLDLMVKAEDLPGALIYTSEVVPGAEYLVTKKGFSDPEFIELAMSDERVMELAKTRCTSDVAHLKEMLAHEASLTSGVL